MPDSGLTDVAVNGRESDVVPDLPDDEELDFFTDPGFSERHTELAAGYGGLGDPDDPAEVQAMQMVLYLPKAELPARSDVLAAAAAAAVALCLDPRVGSEGEWEQRYLAWKRSRIRKVARRARGAQWAAANEVAGVTVESGGALVRALVPGPVGSVDARIRRLQIGGTDLESDDPGPVPLDVPVFWVNAELGMTVGKAAAQVGHASMLFAGALPVEQARTWARRGFACAVREAGPDQWEMLRAAVTRSAATAVRDAGFTEVAPGSTTVIATRPARPDQW
ncbi:aminoacyl-tRNA hydrolase [Nocardia sp. NBC_00416]|uniref:aminoacyl-tRNA hydrolase n=1 Tax=Nocardia sp. NBC_00416 TaxID=2975991 RepID=UPI002E22BDE7